MTICGNKTHTHTNAPGEQQNIIALIMHTWWWAWSFACQSDRPDEPDSIGHEESLQFNEWIMNMEP